MANRELTENERRVLAVMKAGAALGFPAMRRDHIRVNVSSQWPGRVGGIFIILEDLERDGFITFGAGGYSLTAQGIEAEVEGA